MEDQFDTFEDDEEEGAEGAGEQDIFEDAGQYNLDPEIANQVIGLRATDGTTNYVPAPEAMTLDAALARSGIALVGDTEFYLGAAKIDRDTIIAPGQTVTVIGTQKGGAF